MKNYKTLVLRFGAACGVAGLMMCAAGAADAQTMQAPEGRPGRDVGPAGGKGMERPPMERMMRGPQGGQGPHDGGRAHGAPFLHGITLSEAQQDKLFQIRHALAPQLRDLYKAAQKAHEALRQLPLTAQFDEAKAKSLADAGARAMADIALLHARSEQQIYALLTPEQRKTVDDHKQRQGNRGQHPMPR